MTLVVPENPICELNETTPLGSKVQLMLVAVAELEVQGSEAGSAK